VRTKDAIEVPVPATVEKVDIEIGELGRKGVGVVLAMAGTILVNAGNGNGARQRTGITMPLEKIAISHAAERGATLGQLDTARLWQVEPDDARMGTKHLEGIVVASLDNPCQCGRIWAVLFVRIGHAVRSLYPNRTTVRMVIGGAAESVAAPFQWDNLSSNRHFLLRSSVYESTPIHHQAK
jgi:hypothetical protein